MLMMRRWSVRHAALMERAYGALLRGLRAMRPLARAIGVKHLQKPVTGVERAVKGILFDCQMCGRCVLSANGMSCPMNCPKHVHNGPCGGVRPTAPARSTPPCAASAWKAGTGRRAWRLGNGRMRQSRPPSTT